MKSKLEIIFSLFDSENKGVISAEQIDLDSVPAEVLLVFKPLLIEMETYQEQLDQEEFIESSEALLKAATNEERLTILNFGRRQKPVEQYSFQPKLTNKTNEIAKRVIKKYDALRPSKDPVQRFQIMSDISKAEFQ